MTIDVVSAGVKFELPADRRIVDASLNPDSRGLWQSAVSHNLVEAEDRMNDGCIKTLDATEVAINPALKGNGAKVMRYCLTAQHGEDLNLRPPGPEPESKRY